MSLRLAVLAVMASAVSLVAPNLASAAPDRYPGITISVAPKPIIAGEGVLIYGQLKRGPADDRKIELLRHLTGSASGYQPIAVTTTDAQGYYEFARAQGIVETNRSWFVREVGRPAIHSRTVRERVAPLVSLSASQSSVNTGQQVILSGHVDPDHHGEPILIQEQGNSGQQWKTIKRGSLGPASSYSIPITFRLPGAYSLRAVFPGDVRNVRGASEPVTVTVEQAQVADFTIHSSMSPIAFGSSATISGVLYRPGTDTPEPGTSVTLCQRPAGQSGLSCGSAGTTGQDGSYQFQVSPVANTVYQVRVTLTPARHTAPLFEGVSDVVSLSSSAQNVTAEQPVTFSGTVSPDKTGSFVYLEQLGADGDWHTVATSMVHYGSRFQFVRRFGTAGSKELRVRIPNDSSNIGSVSGIVTVQVSLPPVATLPPAK